MSTRIERQTPHHAAGLLNALSDPRIYTHLDEDPPESVAALRARLERLQVGGSADGSERWLNWTVFHNDRVAGYVQATVFTDRSVSIAYVLTPDLWGQGIAHHACRAMLTALLHEEAPTRFLADAERDNTRSHRLLERLGFARQREVGEDVFYTADPADVAARIRTASPNPT